MSEKKSNTKKINSNPTKENEKKINTVFEKQGNSNNEFIEELQEELNTEKKKTLEFENKLKLALADFQNLERKFSLELEKNLNTKIDKFILDFLQIYDDFNLAKKAFSENQIDTSGLESILKNMNSLLSKYGVTPIDAVGEIFDPNLHEAISIIEDPELDDSTITKEIRKGYISHQRVIRPSLVEISKKIKLSG